MNLLDSLKTFTTVVADTGDIDAIKLHRPQDATTNPSLLFQAVQKPEYRHLLDDAIQAGLNAPGDRAARTDAGMDKLLVNFACEILKIIPGRVSTEVDARLSFDTAGTVAKARHLIELYAQADVFASTGARDVSLQLRDLYADINLDARKAFRVRVGQSKVPYGFENPQSSQNRLPLDRSDALNSALAGERDLGVFFYYAPKEIRKTLRHLVDSGLKGSGDYGMLALGVYEGQTINLADTNESKHVVARIAVPFEIGGQYLEAGVSGYTWGGCCYVSYLWVAAAARGKGLGTALLDSVERHARGKRCRIVLLSSHSFQAPGFYARRGYEQVARVDDHPVGHSSLYYAKRLDAQ